MKYYLCVRRSNGFTQDSPPRRKHNWELSVALSEEEHQRARQAIGVLREAEFKQNQFAMVGQNYREYFDTLKARLDWFASSQTKSPGEVSIIVLEANRRLLNFLASCWACVQFAENYLKRKYGRNSGNLKWFTQCCNDAEDNNLSYRFLRMLWDYAHHSDLPIGRISLGAKAEENESGTSSYNMELGVDRDLLLKQWDWGRPKDKKLRDEISTMPPSIDINVHVTQMMSVIRKLRSEFQKIEKPEVEANALVLGNLLERVRDRDGEPFLLECEDSFIGTTKLDGLTNVSTITIPTAQVRMNLARKNSKPLDLSKAEEFRLALVQAGFWRSSDLRSPLNDTSAYHDLDDNLRMSNLGIQIQMNREGEKFVHTVTVGDGESATSELYQIAYCQAVVNGLGLIIA